MKKMLKCGIAFMLCFAMMMLAACGGSNGPSDAVSKSLDELKKSEISDSALGNADASLNDNTKEAYKAFMEKLHDFDYEITDEKISDDGESADVTVKITTYDFGNAYLDTYEELLQKNDPDKITQDMLYGTMFKKMSELKDKKYSEKITVKCTKSDDEWKPSLNGNAQFQNALFGGTIKIVSELANNK